MSLILVLILLLASVSPAWADNVPCQPPKLESVRQPTMPTRYKVASNVPRPEIVEAAFQEWQGLGLSFIRVEAEEHGVVVVGTGWVGRVPYAGAIPGRPFEIALTIEKLDPGGDPTGYQRVVTHEVGHILGLGHSTCPDSILYPAYDGSVRLSTLDRQVIESLYPAPFRLFLPAI